MGLVRGAPEEFEPRAASTRGAKVRSTPLTKLQATSTESPIGIKVKNPEMKYRFSRAWIVCLNAIFYFLSKLARMRSVRRVARQATRLCTV